tara:strand:+ start:317 stop:1135 length:819 start_codon:yes stop_codon:yes gene_type:complete
MLDELFLSLRNNISLFKKNISGIYLTQKPIGSKIDYLKIFKLAKKNNNSQIAKIEKDLGFRINKNWLNKLALKTQIVIKKSDINYQHGRLLYCLIRKKLSNFNEGKNFNVLEVGTARGFSSIVISKAINDSKKKGSIATIDIIPHHKKIYWNTIDDVNGPQTRKSLLKHYRKYQKIITFFTGKSLKIIKKISHKQYHFIFLDGNHDFYNVKQEYELVKNLQKKNDILLLDDVTVKKFDGIVKLLELIRKENKYKIRKITSDPKRGYAILTKK